jgi:hypothetical protein
VAVSKECCLPAQSPCAAAGLRAALAEYPQLVGRLSEAARARSAVVFASVCRSGAHAEVEEVLRRVMAQNGRLPRFARAVLDWIARLRRAARALQRRGRPAAALTRCASLRRATGSRPTAAHSTVHAHPWPAQDPGRGKDVQSQFRAVRWRARS